MTRPFATPPSSPPLGLVQVASSPDLLVVRQRTRTLGIRLGLDAVQVTKLGTALSELCRSAMRGGPSILSFQLLAANRLAISISPPVPWDGVRALVDSLGALIDVDGHPALCIVLPTPAPGEVVDDLAPTDHSSELQQVQVAHRELVHAHYAEGRARLAAERANLELAATNTALARRTRELARSNRDLEVISAAAAHDLKEPLQVIRMFSAILSRSSPEVAEQAQRIHQAADRMADMLKGLMALTRVRADQQGGACDLRQIAGEVTADLTSLLEHTRGTVQVLGDARVALPAVHLRAVVQNLVVNALKYGRDGVLPRVRVQALGGPRGVQVRVIDNGRGVPAERRDAIFELFHRLERDRCDEGTGVGLALVRRILDEYDAAIAVEDAPDAGTCFVLDLPGELCETRP